MAQKTERNNAIRARYQAGATLYELADIYGITKQRVAAIVYDLPKHYGVPGNEDKKRAYRQGVNERKASRQVAYDQISEMYKSGLTQLQIAVKVGKTQTWVSTILAKAQPTRQTRYRGNTVVVRQRVHQLKQKGFTQNQIAAQVNISQSAVSMILRTTSPDD